MSWPVHMLQPERVMVTYMSLVRPAEQNNCPLLGPEKRFVPLRALHTWC